jgi:3-hydroxyacyl-[acyl-carrier-protein] dehydratase
MTATSDEIFKVESLVRTDNVIKANLSVNAGSPIFKGHFPEQPVVPGACILQIVKEVLENELGYGVQLIKGDSLKFLVMISPMSTLLVLLEITFKLIDDHIAVNAKLAAGDRVCFKFQGTFV